MPLNATFNGRIDFNSLPFTSEDIDDKIKRVSLYPDFGKAPPFDVGDWGMQLRIRRSVIDGKLVPALVYCVRAFGISNPSNGVLSVSFTFTPMCKADVNSHSYRPLPHQSHKEVLDFQKSRHFWFSSIERFQLDCDLSQYALVIGWSLSYSRSGARVGAVWRDDSEPARKRVPQCKTLDSHSTLTALLTPSKHDLALALNPFPHDTCFIFPRAHGKRLWANSQLLRSASPYFETLLEAEML
ncbi:hypothetical protein T439DRAFT_50851 [Meredithblackwellia eburnea MCA 4105]